MAKANISNAKSLRRRAFLLFYEHGMHEINEGLRLICVFHVQIYYCPINLCNLPSIKKLNLGKPMNKTKNNKNPLMS